MNRDSIAAPVATTVGLWLPLAILDLRMRAAGGTVQIAAGVCDALENAALLVVLARQGDARMSGLARSAARVKFAGLATGWLYSGAAWLSRRAMQKDRMSAGGGIR